LKNDYQTFPLMKSALAKRTKLMLQPNFAKEPFSPFLTKAGLREIQT